MKGLCILLAALAVAAAAVLNPPIVLSAQSPSQPTAAQSSRGEIPFILVELSGSLNAKKLKPGDKVKAQVAQDVLAHGRIIIPAEAKLLGHVTEASARSENAESRLGLVFDKILLKHHEEMDIQGVVQTVAPPVIKRSRVDEPDPMMPPPAISAQNSPMAPLGSSKGNQTPSSTNSPRPTGNATGPLSGNVPITTASTLPGTPGYTPIPRVSDSSAQNQSLSMGMRQGVFGLKGLSLSTETGGPTPGPVIVSKVADVKLQGGTQMLLKILDSPANRPPSPSSSAKNP